MKIKQALKRITSAGLSVALALSPAITSYADGTSGNASGSDHGGVVTSSGGDFVDRNDPTKVISVNDAGEPVVFGVVTFKFKCYNYL